jgi:hypothetical protein
MAAGRRRAAHRATPPAPGRGRPLCAAPAPITPRPSAPTPPRQLLWHKDGLAIISGLNSDAPLGTKLAFVSGASG